MHVLLYLYWCLGELHVYTAIWKVTALINGV